MTRILNPLILTLAGVAATLPALVVTTPALAQSAMREIEVFGTDPCPRSTDDDVVVCVRRSEKDRYRIPERLRDGGSLQARQSWAQRAMAIEHYGKSGINSCSPVGPAGFTGCMQQTINQAMRERREQTASEVVPDE
ncbi:hypothetical protein SH584_09305 [Sphingomonas sp. LY29]|jgi:hypothetical protein|uniref:hypothetical protein n=1 Tax=unclassified Sphingomonas TaxID=196159 RepID=UPI002ADEC262|nr:MULTISPECIES: hypothetical protein [unclassified Sphingomonas]MEA1072094.1 hypothetical protein [Sphingomonas sp. LY160]WRP25242.1 hypothetical protein SH584_09305 [Sphingomonas sp. LY29]